MAISAYPVIKKGGFIHLMPDGGLVQVETGSRDPLWRWMLDEVDNEFVQIMKLCDGTRSVNDIIKQASSNKNFSLTENKVKSVIELAEWRRVIDMLDSPQFREVQLQGSKDWYAPLHIYLEITNHCNLRCKHCYRNAGPGRQDYLDLNVVEKTLTNLVSMGLRAVEITGGEPLVHPQAAEIINLAASKCDIVALLTNGYYLDEKFIDSIRPAIEAQKIMASITVNSSTPNFHDQFAAVPGSWQRATKGVKLLSKAGVMVRFTMNIAPGNLDDLERSVILAKELGAQAFAASPVMPFGRGSKLDWRALTPAELRQFEQDFERLARKYRGFFLTIPDSIRRRLSAQHCGAGFRTFAVSPTGEIRPCVNVSEHLLNFGNIKSDKVTQILCNPAIRSLRNLRPPGPSTCLGCKLETFCQLCWYRGLMGSQNVDNCQWIKTTDLLNYVDISKVKIIAKSCNLKYHHSFREVL